MRQYEKSLRLGLTVVLCALIARLFSCGLIPKAAAMLNTPQIRDFLIYLETGRAVRSSSLQETLSYPAESARPVIPETLPPQPETLPSEAVPPETKGKPQPFTGEEAEKLKIYNTSGLTADPEGLLLKQLPMQKSDGPRVLLFSTHSTESYTPGTESYSQTAAYRTLDEGYNMLSIGKALQQELEARGIETLRDDTLHDYPSYNSAYSHSRKTVKKLLQSCPSVVLALDLHRDAADTPSGQLRTLARVEGHSSAQLMLVVGTDARGLVHPNWEENLSVALKLQALLERHSPGITRPTCLRPQRFNQDLSPGCLIVEIGGAGNTRQEALAAIPVLAQAIEELLEMEEE